MDDLLREFLTETTENLDTVDVELVKFERHPNDAAILNNIFRVVHTIKGTCGFLGLPRLASLAHAAETLLDRYRDGQPVLPDGVSAILHALDRIKQILHGLEASGGQEPAGVDGDLIEQLNRLANGAAAAPPEVPAEAPAAEEEAAPAASGAADLDELERIFRETASEALPIGARNRSAQDGDGQPRRDAPAAAAATPVHAGSESVAAAPVRESSIRVSVDTLEHLMTVVSELVLTRNQLLEIVRRSEESEYKIPLQRLSAVTGELQQAVMTTRMQPIGNAWQKLPRLVRDLSNELGKDIELDMRGAETELDRQVLDIVKDPLTHMVRNSADHGLEMPHERERLGKPRKGRIRLSAYHEGGHIVIEISDDGRGLDVERIRRKAIQSRLLTSADAAGMSEAQILRVIFQPGFSTAAAVTNVSGRGVGMDVVRSNIESIGGSIDVRTKPGAGTTFLIRIPLTLAILSALIVQAGGERFAFPQIAVIELVRVDQGTESRIERLKGAPVLRLRQSLLPVIRLAQLLGLEPEQATQETDGFVVVMQVGGARFGVAVDLVLQMEEIVVKPLSQMLRDVTVFSGSTILGNGQVVMIIDPNGIAQAAHTSSQNGVEPVAGRAEAQEQAAQTHSLLLFRAGSKARKAVPVSLVTRLEEIDAAKIEHANGCAVFQYRGELIPLVYFDEATERRSSGMQPVLIFADGGRSTGLVVDEIVDIVEDTVSVQLPTVTEGIVGTAVIRGQATELLDVSHFLARAYPNWFRKVAAGNEMQPKRLLLVDDSSFFRSLIEPVLRGAGYDVAISNSAVEALERLRQGEAFSAVITDIEMPEMDGYAFAEELRSTQRFGHMPIIAMSGLATPGAIARGRAAGFTDYIAKFDRGGLLAALEEFGVPKEKAA